MNRRLYTQNRTVDSVNNNMKNSERNSERNNVRNSEYIGEYKEQPRIHEPKAMPAADDIGGVFGGGVVRSILGYLPPGVYNKETKKLFGILTAEDLLLVALILLIADSDKDDNAALLIALAYILLT